MPTPRYLTGSLFACAFLASLFGSSNAIAQSAPPASAPAPTTTTDTSGKSGDESVVTLEKFVTGDSSLLGTNTPTASVFGFDKTTTETPRSITIIPDIQLTQMNLTKSEDIAKAVPGTYTNFRFGLQGTVSIRNQSSDFFFDGMRRLDPQGIFESVWGAYDSLEVVEGIQPQIFGLGRMGGYVNFIPKSARAANNEYISSDVGTASIQYGSFNTTIGKLDYQMPFKLFGNPSGLAMFIESKDSDGYKSNGFSHQRLFQGGLSSDLNPDWRVQVGFSYQTSNGGLPGGDNRTTATTVYDQTYWSGNFSYQIESPENGVVSVGNPKGATATGKIDEQEFRDSYFWGTPQLTIQVPSSPTFTAPANYSTYQAATSQTVSLTNGVPSANAPGLFNPSLYFASGSNDPLFRTIPWQGSAIPQGQGTWTQDGGKTFHTGNITMAQFLAGYTDTAAPALVGMAPIQRTGFQMMFYPTTTDNFAAASAGILTKSGNIPYKGIKYAYWMPPPFDLNPSSWVQEKWNKRQSIGEDYYLAHIGAYYLDLINDTNPDRTIKNQIFIDSNDQTKSGSNAYSQTQHPTTFEDKMTATKKFEPFPWLKVQALASANYWYCWTALVQNSGDSDIDMRRDLQRDGPSGNETLNTFTSNDRWYSMTESSSYTNGLPVGANNQSQYSTTGAGVELDQTFFNVIDVTSGGRYDYIDAHAFIPAGTLDLGSTGSLSTTYLGPQNVSGSGGPNTYIGGTGTYIPYTQSGKGNSSGGSWSTSVEYKAPFGMHPYVTYGYDTVMLNGTGGGTWTPGAVKNAITGRDTLFEVGMKANIGPKIYYQFAYYNQYRAAFSPITTTGGGAGNTISRGEEAKLVVNPIKPLTISVSGNWSLVHNEQGGSVTEPASAFGVPNVVDANGNVVIPADAWAWGGRIQTTIPDSEPRYRRSAGLPAAIITSNGNYDLGGGYFVGMTYFYQSKYALDRLDTMWVPDGHTFDAVIGYRSKKWEISVNATNIFNSNIYNFAGFATWVDPKFQRALNVTVARHF